MSIGRRITAMRGYRMMTQDELGELVGVAKQTVSNWEHDRRVPRANELKALCRALMRFLFRHLCFLLSSSLCFNWRLWG